jgi:AcrR family transcriptional regulator
MQPDFTFAQFQTMTPLDAGNIWAYLLDHHGERITVKRRKPALENLERIFNATFKLANDVGFRAMNLRDLCQETGLSMGGLYGYIASKDQLAEMIGDVVRHATHQVPLLFYISEILQPWFYFVYMDSRVLQPELRQAAKNSELYVQSLFADVIARLPARPAGSADLLASHLMATFQDWYVKRWKYRAADVSPDQFADSAVRMMRGCLAMPGVAIEPALTAQ